MEGEAGLLESTVGALPASAGCAEAEASVAAGFFFFFFFFFFFLAGAGVSPAAEGPAALSAGAGPLSRVWDPLAEESWARREGVATAAKKASRPARRVNLDRFLFMGGG